MSVPEVSKPVVVGIDGSSPALDATGWAAAEARRRRTWLRIVFADVVSLVYLPSLPTMALPETYTEAMSKQAHIWLHRARGVATAAAPGVEVRTAVRIGGPPPVLIDESRHAQLVVVGSRGLGGFTGLIVGSVTVALAAHTHCPVAVVRQPPTAPADAPVVVGVGDPEHDSPVLGLAFDAASMRHAPLEALHAWHEIGTEAAWSGFHTDGRGSVIQRNEERILDDALAEWAEKHPDVELRRIVAHRKPAGALIDHARHAQLVVVGSRGRGGITGALLGSTSRQLVHHAPCPLIVARWT